MIPTVAEQALGDAHLIVDALKFAWTAALRLVMTVGTVGSPIADEALINALASVAAKKMSK